MQRSIFLAAPMLLCFAGAFAGGSNYGIAPGAKQLSGKISEWPVPTPKFARDPAPGPDGNIYITVMQGDRIARFDTRTQKFNEWDLPSGAHPHGLLVDKEGKVWYTDFGEMFIGKFDPKSLKLVEYPIRKFKDKAPEGLLSIEFDHEGKIWFDTMYQGSLGCLDPKTGKIDYYPVAKEWNDDTVQLNFSGLRHDVDGKVWTKTVGTQHIFRLDIKTGQWERFHPTDFLPADKVKGASIYQVISDSQNNLWMAEFTRGHIGKIDAKTTKVTWWPFPTENARGRRMNIDDQDRITVTEYRGNKVAVFDTRAEKFTEYELPPRTYPYRANFDKNGEIWASTMHTDRVVRLDPKTGTAVQYLMPSDTNMRTVFVDNSTTPTTFWVGSNHDHRIVKVEPLD